MHKKPASLRLALALGLVQCLALGGSGGLASVGAAAAWAAGDAPAAGSAISAAPSLPPPPVADAAPAAGDPAQPVGAVKASAAPAAASDSSGRDDKFRDLERRAFELKDQVFRSKARLTLLSETLVSSNVGTTRAVIVHKNQMGRLFQPIRVSYQIDGREIFTREDVNGGLANNKDLVVWDDGVKPGEHTIGVTVVYRGNGAKVFAYYDKYNFTARAAHRLTAIEGQTTRLSVRCFEKGNVLTSKVEDRPEFEFKVAGDSPRGKAAGEGAASASPPAAASGPAAQPTEVKAK